MTTPDPDEVEGNRIILAEMAEKAREAERDHEYRMAKAKRAFMTVTNPQEFILAVLFFSAVVTATTLSIIAS